MKVTLDKIASVTRNARIPREVLLSDEICAREGMVLAVRIHGTKTVYNHLEDVHGRMIGLNDGDVIAAVLGSRRALRGYAGVVPESISVGDRLDVLNLGGVIGRCTSVNLELGKPLQAEVLGQILAFPHLGERLGVPASIKTGAVPWADHLEKSAPIVYVAGTCMNAGKTFACGEVIRYLARKGLKVAGAKLTGVSLLRDTMSMVDRGAFRSISFNDAGVVSTTGKVSVPVAKGLINELNKDEPDVLVIELGDGILGEYGVQEILHDDELMNAGSAHIMCANDPVAAWGAVELFKNTFKRRVDLISGPATDNAVGKEFIENKIGVKAMNARIEYDALGAFVEKAVFGGVPA